MSSFLIQRLLYDTANPLSTPFYTFFTFLTLPLDTGFKTLHNGAMLYGGIDPGPVKTAYAVWDGEKILEVAHVENAEMLDAIWADRGDDFVMWTCEMIASYGMAVGAEVFETCVWIGRYIQKAEVITIPPMRRLKRKEICLHLCGSVRAKDGNIRQALIDRIGPQGTKKNPGPTYGVAGDMWAALAVAVTAYDMWGKEA